MRERELITRQPSKGENDDSETPRSQFTSEVVSPAAAEEGEEVGASNNLSSQCRCVRSAWMQDSDSAVLALHTHKITLPYA